VVLIAIFVYESGSFMFAGNEKAASLMKLKEQFDIVKKEGDSLRNDLDHYLNPDNLEKELRARFNYRKEGEKLIIMVATGTATTTQ
jgi:hypothetical protein